MPRTVVRTSLISIRMSFIARYVYTYKEFVFVTEARQGDSDRTKPQATEPHTLEPQTCGSDGAWVTRRRIIVNQLWSYRFGVTRGWVCGWTNPLSNITQATVSFLNVMLILYNSSTSWMCYSLDKMCFFLIIQLNSSRQSQNRAFVHLRAALLFRS